MNYKTIDGDVKIATEPMDSTNNNMRHSIPSRETIECRLHIKGKAADIVNQIIASGPAGITSKELPLMFSGSHHEINIAINLLTSLGIVSGLCTGDNGEQFILSPSAVAALYGRKEYDMHLFRPFVIDGFRFKDKILLVVSMERFWKYPLNGMVGEMQAISNSVENAIDVIRQSLVDDYNEYLEPSRIQVYIHPGSISLIDILGDPEKVS